MARAAVSLLHVLKIIEKEFICQVPIRVEKRRSKLKGNEYQEEK